MKDGFIKVAAGTPDVTVGDCVANADAILAQIREMEKAHAKIMVFPELCITGYTCHDLFLQDLLIAEARRQLNRILHETEKTDALIFVGLPWELRGKLYNVAAVLNRGRLLGLVPKKNLPTYNEFYERRQFTPGHETVEWLGSMVPFGMNLLFYCEEIPRLKVAAELCEDLWVPCPPSISHAACGATVIANLSASNEMIGKDTYRKNLVSQQSASLICGYIYASAGEGESTQDLVFGGHNIIAENGTILAESKRFRNGIIYSEIDVSRLTAERRRTSTYPDFETASAYGAQDGASLGKTAALSSAMPVGASGWVLGDHVCIPFQLREEQTALTRTFAPHPFVPEDPATRDQRCEEILTIQAMGLKKRLHHIHASHAVIGISGGLDSTLALLVTVKAFDMLNLPREGIIAVTMPCFGTTDRTYRNACTLIRELGVTFREIRLNESVTLHFRDIGHDMSVHDVTYENGQARERTQVLMDVANQAGGIVIGTGDLSELALGWATYNGDHMSMYAVNCSVPKTLVRHLVRYYADTCGEEKLSSILLDILDTPVSPELLPPENGVISQKTEDLVGPYELHDFFLYYMLRAEFTPSKIYRIANRTFAGKYTDTTILKWLKNFYRRFFSQQFKRSCLPDGPKVGSVALSPRGDLRMPSDASARIWLDEIDALCIPEESMEQSVKTHN